MRQEGGSRIRDQDHQSPRFLGCYAPPSGQPSIASSNADDVRDGMTCPRRAPHERYPISVLGARLGSRQIQDDGHPPRSMCLRVGIIWGRGWLLAASPRPSVQLRSGPGRDQLRVQEFSMTCQSLVSYSGRSSRSIEQPIYIRYPMFTPQLLACSLCRSINPPVTPADPRNPETIKHT